MKIKILLLFISISFLSCNSKKETAIAETETNTEESTYFDVGQGGGFSGLYTEYRVYSDGKTEKYDFVTENHLPLMHMRKEDVAKYFDQIEELGLFEMELSVPDNMSDYIIVYSGQDSNKLVWPYGGKSVSPEIYALFKEVFDLCNKKSKTSTSGG